LAHFSKIHRPGSLERDGMQCPRCQHQNPSQAKFCEECATPLVRTCANCGTQLSPRAKFCPECAHPLAAGTAPQPRFGSPESYTPKHLAEKILTSKAALEGERKQVTVLFADMKGSMELLADRDPEDARKILDPVLERMMEAVHRYEGTVNQVMGDGIMALFGAPLAHEDHAVRACYAALRMQEAVTRYADNVRRVEGIPIQIRVGLNSGEVVVRSIGSDLHMDYTAVGQTTHVAARMEQMALPGSILLSADTLALAEGYVRVKALGLLPVKGLATPLEVYEATGAAMVRSRFQAAAHRGLTRFVGRESELEQLHRALERTRAGQGQVVAVVGEPGVGKSRLYWELSHSHRAQSWLTLESGSVSYGKATNYLPIIELLRSYFSIESGDDTRKIREKVTGKLLSLDRQLEPCVSPILWLLDVPIEDENWERLDPPQRRQRVLDGMRRLLLRESQVQPLMVLFEDLHWIDGETQAFLDTLVESLPAARLLLLVNYRPEYSHGWGSKTYYRQLQMAPLPPEGAESLLDALLGTDAALTLLKRLLIERTDGNPFFIEESVRSLVETTVLAGERGAYRLTRTVEGFQVPATAKAMLAARIDRLAADDKRVLQVAAVIGTDVPFALLEALADEPEDRLRRSLAQLQATEFLYETRLFPDLEYTFRHALTHEVAYGSLLQERRRTLHARIVEAIERLYPDRLNEQAERLAHHAVRGDGWDKAVRYSYHAGVKASSRSAYREAVAYFEQALAGLRHLPETSETLEQAIDLRFELRVALNPFGELGRISDYLQEAEDIAKILGDHRRLALVSVYRSFVSWQSDRATDARAHAQVAHLLAQELGDFDLDVASYLALGVASHFEGDLGAAVEFLGKVITLLGGAKVRERSGLVSFPAVMARAYTAHALVERGAFHDGMACGREALALAEQFQQPWSLVLALIALAHLHDQQGDFGMAIPLLERALASSREWELEFLTPLTTASLAHAYVMSGRLADGWALLEPMLQRGVPIRQPDRGRMFWRCEVLLQLSEVFLATDRLGQAQEFGSLVLEVTRDGGVRRVEAQALHLLGNIATRGELADVGAGEAYCRAALALASELGVRPLAAHCHLDLGQMYARTGQREEARQHFVIATTMYREMDMRFWLEKAGAEMRV
jgi:class 3 adenylate cyclase/tetratricopeptide (TPR) repeat protein